MFQGLENRSVLSVGLIRNLHPVQRNLHSDQRNLGSMYAENLWKLLSVEWKSVQCAHYSRDSILYPKKSVNLEGTTLLKSYQHSVWKNLQNTATNLDSMLFNLICIWTNLSLSWQNCLQYLLTYYFLPWRLCSIS